jgi:hypothetical protein
MNRRIFFATVILALSPQLALADTRDDVMAGMQRCRSIPDDRIWLECAYGAQQPMRAKLGLQPAPDYQQRLVPPATSAVTAPAPAIAAPPAVNTAPRPAAAPVPRPKGSFLQILGGNAPPVAVSTLASVEYDANDAFHITLQNGQTWHQVNAGVAPKARLKPGTKVTIRPGALGSYNLRADGHTYKVEPKS